MSPPTGPQQITGIAVSIESIGPKTAVHYTVTLAGVPGEPPPTLTIAGQCDALDAALPQLRAGNQVRVTFPLTVNPNPTLWITAPESANA